MRQMMTCTAALLVAACGAEATPNTPAMTENSAALPVATAAAAEVQPDGWAGEYKGRTDGGNGQVSIRATGSNGYAVAMETANTEGCGGEVEGRALVSNGHLVMTTPIPDGNGQACRIVLTRTANGISAEATDCSYFHGMGCGFDGTFARSGGGAVTAHPSTSASAASATWLVGNWIHKGGYCASGDVIVFAKGGGYGNAGGDFEGAWSLAGSKLTLAVAEADPITGEASGSRRRSTLTVKSTGTDAMTLNSDFYRRCPARGGAEPWHPNERFEVQ